MQTLSAQRAKEAATIVLLAVILIAAILLVRWRNHDAAPPEMVDAKITGFTNSFRRGSFGSRIIAFVRLPDGRTGSVSWADDRVVCRVGDTVSVERHDHYLRLVKADCR